MTIEGKRFLLVEDEPIIGFALEDMMIEAGAETRFASSLDQAMKLVTSEAFDAAVLDVNLHGRESYPLARELRQRSVMVVFATGYGIEPLPEDLSDMQTIAKPYDINAIRGALEKAADQGG